MAWCCQILPSFVLKELKLMGLVVLKEDHIIDGNEFNKSRNMTVQISTFVPAKW